MSKTAAEVLFEQGHIVGREQGRLQTKREDLCRVLRMRWREIPAEWVSRVEQIQEPERLDRLFDQALTVGDISELSWS